MRALWSDRPNCSHNVSQKVKRIGRFSEMDTDADLSFASPRRSLKLQMQIRVLLKEEERIVSKSP